MRNARSSEPDPVDAVIQTDVAEKVRRMIQSLPEPQRVCVILQFYHGFSINEIADVVKCPTGTVKSRLHNGLQSLRVMLGEVRGE